MHRSMIGVALIGVLLLTVACVTVALMAPPGVPWLSAVGRLVGITACAGLLVWAGARWGYRHTSAPAEMASRAALVVTGVLVVGLTIRAVTDLETGRQLSMGLMQNEPATHLQVLRPNLKNAVLFAPDRPHHPEDVNAPDRAEALTRMRTFYASTNQQGLRGGDFQSPAPGFRVVCIGDSVTFGWGVGDDETYPAQLAKALGAEVLNAGMPAFKPNQITTWLQYHAADLDMDVLVLAVRPNHSNPDPWSDYSRNLRMIVSTVAPAKVAVVLPPLSTFDPLGAREGPDEARRVAEMAKKTGNIPFLDLTPAFRVRQKTGVVMEISGEIQRMIQLPDRNVLAEGSGQRDRLAPELVAVFEADPEIREQLFFDGGHPDRPGYKLFAEQVADLIRAQGWIPEVR